MTRLCTTMALTLAVAASAAAANAEPFQDHYAIEFRYDRTQSVDANYRQFVRQAKRTCETPGKRPILVIQQEKACVGEIIDKAVAAFGRADLASLHFDRTGRKTVPARSFAFAG